MRAAIVSALLAALLMLAAELLIGELEYRCTAQARLSLRRQIFAKALELDVGNIEKVGPVSAITASVDGVESMQVYYSKIPARSALLPDRPLLPFLADATVLLAGRHLPVRGLLGSDASQQPFPANTLSL